MSVQVFANLKKLGCVSFYIDLYDLFIYSEYKSFVSYVHCTYFSQAVQRVFNNKNVINVFWIKWKGWKLLGAGGGVAWESFIWTSCAFAQAASICCRTHSALLISIRRWLILFYISRQLFHLYYHSGPSVSLSYVRKEIYTFLYLIKIAWQWT